MHHWSSPSHSIQLDASHGTHRPCQGLIMQRFWKVTRSGPIRCAQPCWAVTMRERFLLQLQARVPLQSTINSSTATFLLCIRTYCFHARELAEPPGSAQRKCSSSNPSCKHLHSIITLTVCDPNCCHMCLSNRSQPLLPRPRCQHDLTH